MPELPEVETVRKGLERLVVGKTIDTVTVLWRNRRKPNKTSHDKAIYILSVIGGRTVWF